MVTLESLKVKAKRFGKILKNENLLPEEKVSHAFVLDVFAFTLGFKNWVDLNANMKPALTQMQSRELVKYFEPNEIKFDAERLSEKLGIDIGRAQQCVDKISYKNV